MSGRAASLSCGTIGRLRAGSAAAVLILAGCSAFGNAPASPAPSADAQRLAILSLNPCIDAILVAIAPRDQVLALSH
ncbi:MAG: hypothetical protein ACXIT4_07120 [Erythrobacter sp.]